jgi:multicomponent Na+:H+ antiporter subunit F
MNATLTVFLVLLVASAVSVVGWAARARTLAGRAVAFDVLASVMTCGLLVSAAITGDGLFLELAVVLGLLGFLTAVTVARFIERTGQ